MIRILGILLVSFLSFGLKAQLVEKNHVKTSPLRIFDPINPAIELSYERSHGTRCSTELSGAFVHSTLLIFPHLDVSGYRLSVEEKSFTRIATDSRKYLSLELVGNHVRFTDETSYYDSVNTVSLREKYSGLRRTGAVNLKLGKQIYRRRIVIDYSVGLGIKYRDVRHINRVHDVYLSKDLNILHATMAEMKQLTMNVPLNIKIGYSF